MDILSLPAEPSFGPGPLTMEEIAAYVVAAAVWAPSVHNTQPWWFRADGQEISLYVDAGRQLMVADPRGREMMISCGAALFTARLALRSLGYIPGTCVLPDPARPLLVARVSWQRRAAAAGSSSGCSARCGGGGHTAAVSIPCRCRRTCLPCCKRAERDGAMLRIIDGEPSRAVLAAAVETAEHALRADGVYGRELAAWAPAPGSARCDGVPHTAYRRGPNAPSRTLPAATSPAAAAGAPPWPARRRRPGPPGWSACWQPPVTARWTG